MGINKKIWGLFIFGHAAMLSAVLFYVLPRIKGFYDQHILPGWLPDEGSALALIEREFLILSLFLAVLSVAVAALSIYMIRIILKPVNSIIGKMKGLFFTGAASGANLNDVSENIEKLCSYSNVLDSVPLGVMLVDSSGIIRYFNREAGEITELQPASAINRPMIDFFPNNFYSYTIEVINSGREYLSLRNIIKAGGFFKELLFSVSPLYNGSQVSGAVAVFQDVTPQRKMIEVEAAYSMARDLALQKDIDGTVRVIARAAAEMVNIQFSAIFLADPDGRLLIRSSHGIPGEIVEEYNSSPFLLDSPEIKDLYRGKAPLLHGDVRKNSYLRSLLLLQEIQSFYSFPIIYENRLIGLLNLYSRDKDKLSRDMIYLMQSLSGQVNTAVSNFYELQRMRAMASVDGLTGLYNRKYFIDTLNMLAKASASTGSPVSLAMIDIDHFKAVNDTHGHQAGDSLLLEIARLLARLARETDVVCRYGGEEFAIIMPDTDRDSAMERVELIRTAVESCLFSFESGNVKVTVSAGVACLPGDVQCADELVRASDTAMYSAKKSGRNRVAQF